MNSPNVLRLNAKEEETAYRTAISRIICDIQREGELTDIDLADAIDVSAETISNARNRKNNLNPLYLKRLGQVYGAKAIDPYLALLGARSVPIEAGEETAAVEKLSALLHQLILASTDAPKGTIPHTRLLPLLPQLGDALQTLTALKARGDRILEGDSA